MSKQKTWVLTRTINQYDQESDYLISVFVSKPSIKELIDFFRKNEKELSIFISSALIGHIFNGGGRIKHEDEWFYLTEIEYSELYKSKYY